MGAEASGRRARGAAGRKSAPLYGIRRAPANASIFSERDRRDVVARYSRRFAEHGHSQEALGWGKKGKQDVRFEVLASRWDFAGARVLDIGAGFGDLYAYLKPRGIRSYHGYELVPALAEKGRQLYGRNKNFRLTAGDFLGLPLARDYDIALISGLFNFKLARGNNDEFIAAVLGKAFARCSVGVAANFITDRVDYREKLLFNASPEKIVALALTLTRSFVLRNDYFPFEFSLFLNKDDSFHKKDTIFSAYKNAR